MSVKQMLEHWDPENILVRNEDLVVLRVANGPERYLYAVSLNNGETELEFEYRTTRRELISDPVAKKFESWLLMALQEMADGMENAEKAPQQWGKNKKRDK
jgi:hypothetical protein